jgi:alpha-beta hydrolase superfamily lysophospholipase
LNIRSAVKKVGLPLVSLLGRLFPEITIKKGVSLNYGYSISKKQYGEWEYDEQWKPLAVSGVKASWLRAIYRAQCELHRGLTIDCPVLVMRSGTSFKSKHWSDKFMESDAVLNVEHIRKYAPLLGKNVTEIVIDGGLHDLFLSVPKIRTKAYNSLFEWLEKNL